MNPFQRHGLTHLSPSQLSTWTSEPGRWVAEKLLGYKSPTSAAMARGSAVEDGVRYGLLTGDHEGAEAEATAAFDRAMMFQPLPGDGDKQRQGIAAMTRLALRELMPFGKPEFAEGAKQHKVSLDCRYGPGEGEIVTIIGYVDFVFSDRVVDLKTTLRMPNEMSWSHKVQRAVYARGTNMPVQFLYTTPAKTAWKADGDVALVLEEIRAVVRRLAAFLALGDAETLRHAVPVIPDSFLWRGEEGARQQLFGI